MPRVYIVHGWEGSPDEGWFPWLRGELSKQKCSVHVLEMPNPIAPQIDSWVRFLAAAVGQPDTDTYLVGHSIGCQTILRYLERLPVGAKIGGAVFVAGWVSLKPAALEDEDAKAVADPWLHRPLSWVKIKTHLPKLVAIASDDDPFVSLEDQHIFRQHLGAEVIIEHSRGHFSGSDGVTMLPAARDAVLRLTNK